jgi:hypothetical protein
LGETEFKVKENARMYGYHEEDYFEVDENFDFNTGINKLLDQEVEKRLAVKVKDYETAIERHEKSQQTISQLRNELHELKLNLSGAEKTFKKVGYDDALRDVLGGFKLGDEVWFIRNTYVREDCPCCFGDREVIAEIKGEEVKVKCPKCNGYGNKSKTKKSVEKGIVKEIHTKTWAEGRQFEGKMYIQPNSYRTHDSVEQRIGDVFKTEEECAAALKAKVEA